MTREPVGDKLPVDDVNATTGDPVSAYLISQVEVLDAEAWENYRTRAAPAIADFGGRYLVRGALAEVIEADWPVEEPPAQAVIVAEFPSMKALRDWYASPQYAEAFAFRAAAVKRRMIFVAGIDERDAGSPRSDMRGNEHA